VDPRSVFEAWLQQLGGSVRAAVFEYCRNQGMAPQRAVDMAEDAEQQALFQAARISDVTARFQNSYKYFWNWVLFVARNHVRSAGRRTGRCRPFAEGEEIAAVTRDGQIDPEFLERLTPLERRFVELYFGEGYTLLDAGHILLPPAVEKTLVTRMWKVKRGIQEQYRQWLEG